LASQTFVQQRNASRKTLVIFSDMRQNTMELNLESLKIVPPLSTVAKRWDAPQTFTTSRSMLCLAKMPSAGYDARIFEFRESLDVILNPGRNAR
jgi:hypothetical protein